MLQIFPAKPVDFLTMFQPHHGLIQSQLCKAVWSGPKHHTLLDAKTTYAASYTPKGIVRCLACYEDHAQLHL